MVFFLFPALTSALTFVSKVTLAVVGFSSAGPVAGTIAAGV